MENIFACDTVFSMIMKTVNAIRKHFLQGIISQQIIKLLY